MYKVEDTSLIGSPVTPPEYKLEFTIDFNGTLIDFEKDIVYKYNDPVKGEVYQPFEIVPYAVADIASKVVIFNEEQAKEIPVIVKGFKDSISGSVDGKKDRDGA